jgi:DNA-directed RNA polymerase subunit M/transcription elongation factor TFIIS
MHETREKVYNIILKQLKEEFKNIKVEDVEELIIKLATNMERSIYNKSIEESGLTKNDIFDDNFRKKYYTVNSLKLLNNIKGKNNPTILSNILNNNIKEYEILYKKQSEINPMKWKELEMKYGVKEENYENYMEIKENEMFKCGKCKSKKVTFYLRQVRSADEPMTSFFTCHNCGKHWKQN